VRITTIGKFGAFLQLAILLLVQFYAVAPGLARSLHHHATVGQCTGDHVKCGCAAERIASRSCCCFQSKRVSSAQLGKDCCKKPAQAERHLDKDGGLDRSVPAFTSIPCGGDPAFSPTATESVKFLKPYLVHATSVPVFTGQYFSQHHSLISRYIDPPVPPPQLSTLS
jgi:hypothetical protein